MALVVRDPTPALRPYARRYYGFGEVTGAPVRRREGPGVDVLIMFAFDHGWRIGVATEPSQALDERASFVAGLHHRAVVTEHDGRSHGLQVSLTPPGAYALFGLPLHELADRTVELDALFGKAADLIVERLDGLRSWDDRFAFVESLLRSRVRARPTRETVWAWRRLCETHGRIAIGSLADELGWSRNRLVARFREEIGVAPKTFARVLRFERAKTLLERGDARPLPQLAFACGYYDQAHLTNEFRRIAGTTPAAYAAETNLQDTAVARA
jgi:AraC-like DNA-binding protein